MTLESLKQRIIAKLTLERGIAMMITKFAMEMSQADINKILNDMGLTGC